MENFLKALVSPLITILKEQGLWDTLVSLYEKVAATGEAILRAFGISSGPSGSDSFFSYVGSFLKLVFDITVTLFNVIIDIIQWALNLIK